MSRNNPNPLKRTLTLDLNTTGSKKARVQQLQHNHILTSPDVQMLKLTSPELAEFLTRNPSLATPTPSGSAYCPKTVTEEQELYAKGFEEALKKMHSSIDGGTSGISHIVVTTAMEGGSTTAPPATSIMTIEKATAAFRNKMTGGGKQQFLTVPTSIPIQQQQPQVISLPLPANPILPPRVMASVPLSVAAAAAELSRPSSGASGSMDSSMDSPYTSNHHIKEELDYDNTSNDSSSTNVTPRKGGRRRTTSSPAPTGSSFSPINLESQEKIKLDRKRLRNRLAASKCRKRKLERISQLDSKVADLKGENSELASVVKKLKDAVYNLKQQVLEHARHGCQINAM